jgi:hypothetical protein
LLKADYTSGLQDIHSWHVIHSIWYISDMYHKKNEGNMESLHENTKEYRIQLEKGAIKEANKGLMEYIMDLRTHF